MERDDEMTGATRIHVPEQTLSVQLGGDDGTPLRVRLDEQMVSVRVALGDAGGRGGERVSARVTIGGRSLRAQVQPD